jgi:glycosyltransferase involved in cell wall biosynthesis
MVDKGHSVTVVTTDVLNERNRISEMEESIGGIRVIRFKNVSNWLAKKFNGYLPIGFYSWCKNNVQDFDIIHCHDFFTYQNIVTAHFCIEYGIPFIIQPHGTLSPIRQDAKFKYIKKIFLWSWSGVLNHSRDIIALTNNEKTEISAIDDSLGMKVSIIPNGIRVKEFKNINKIDLHEKFGIPRSNKVIGYIGRLQYMKGIDISLRILANLKNKLSFTYLIIGPDDGEKNRLKKQVCELGLQNHVIFVDTLSGQEKLEVMKSCNLFLFTSRNEGLPMTVLEIAALGIPQIISRECHVPELEYYAKGSVFDLHEEPAIAEKIIAILSDPKKSDDIQSGGLKMINGVFDMESIAKTLERVYLAARHP